MSKGAEGLLQGRKEEGEGRGGCNDIELGMRLGMGENWANGLGNSCARSVDSLSVSR